MPNANEAVKVTLNLPKHVYAILDGWAGIELDATPEEVVEAIADELATSEELRQYAAELFES
jgi:hypothetical protein